VVVPEEKPILPILYTVEGTVYNATTKEPLPDAEVTAKLKPEMSIYKQTNSDKQGNYSMILEKDRDYELTAQSKDLFFDTFTISQDRKDTVTIVHKDFNIPVILTLRINFPTDVYDAPYQFTLDSNGIETSNKWNAELNNLAKNIIDSKEMIKIINLSGHTDDVSSESYNYQLGLKRVSFIISELVKRGVPKELLLGRSAGEMEPLEKRFGEDLQLYRKRLRRVELEKVLK
jgi:outer membrane protein OmpA-like peptidoglycan-associated protein